MRLNHRSRPVRCLYFPLYLHWIGLKDTRSAGHHPGHNSFVRAWIPEDSLRGRAVDKAAFRKTSLKDLTFHEPARTAVTRLALANCSVAKIASSTGHYEDNRAGRSSTRTTWLGRVELARIDHASQQAVSEL